MNKANHQVNLCMAEQHNDSVDQPLSEIRLKSLICSSLLNPMRPLQCDG